MKARIMIGALLVVGVFGAGTFGSRGGSDVSNSRRWTIVNFVDPVSVQGNLVMGPVMIVHDDARMAIGEACTTFYRFDRARGPREQLASFHCNPVQLSVASETTLTVVDGPDLRCKRLVQYQIAGDAEAHAIPDK
jgi:hypothetical protein